MTERRRDAIFSLFTITLLSAGVYAVAAHFSTRFPNYVGPGDVVELAGFYGTRAFDRHAVIIHQPMMRAYRDGGYIDILPRYDGLPDLDEARVFCAKKCVVRFYDQVTGELGDYIYKGGALPGITITPPPQGR